MEVFKRINQSKRHVSCLATLSLPVRSLIFTLGEHQEAPTKFLLTNVHDEINCSRRDVSGQITVSKNRGKLEEVKLC